MSEHVLKAASAANTITLKNNEDGTFSVKLGESSPTEIFKISASGIAVPANIPTEGAWTDYSGSSTIVGWSSYTLKRILYKDIGKTRFVTFVLYGTSNSTAVSFTLPTASLSNGRIDFPIRAIDNNAEGAIGVGYLADSSASVECYKSGLAAWTASNSKLAAGQFTYQLP